MQLIVVIVVVNKSFWAVQREERKEGGRGEVKLPVALIFRNNFHLKWKNGKQYGEGQKTH